MKLGLRAYVVAFVLLLALSATTFGLSFVDMGAGNLPVALGLASLKAAIVGGAFMHLLETRGAPRLYVALGLLLVVTLVALVVLDVRGR